MLSQDLFNGALLSLDRIHMAQRLTSSMAFKKHADLFPRRGLGALPQLLGHLFQIIIIEPAENLHNEPPPLLVQKQHDCQQQTPDKVCEVPIDN